MKNGGIGPFAQSLFFKFNFTCKISLPHFILEKKNLHYLYTLY